MIDNGVYGAIGGMKIGRGSRSTRIKPVPVSLCPPQIPHDLTRFRIRTAEVEASYGTAGSAEYSAATTYVRPV
jgi:hypothetical protein